MATSGGITPTSVTSQSPSHASLSSSSSKQGQVTGTITLTTIRHGFADYNSIYHRDLERKEEWHQERMALAAAQAVTQECKDAKEMAIERVQEVDSSHLLEKELAGIIEIFAQDCDSARAYLMIKIEGVRKL